VGWGHNPLVGTQTIDQTTGRTADLAAHRDTLGERLRAVAAELEQAADALAAAKQRRHALVCEAVDQGMSHRYVASAAGISGGMVHKLLATSSDL